MALPQPQLQPPAVDPGALSASITASMSARRLVVSARTYLGCCTLVFCGKKAKRTWHSQMNVSSPPPPLSPTQSLSDHTTNVPISFPVNMCVCVCVCMHGEIQLTLHRRSAFFSSFWIFCSLLTASPAEGSPAHRLSSCSDSPADRPLFLFFLLVYLFCLFVNTPFRRWSSFLQHTCSIEAPLP
jgi:hypothetical protein